jgi:hypothetical protein
MIKIIISLLMVVFYAQGLFAYEFSINQFEARKSELKVVRALLANNDTNEQLKAYQRLNESLEIFTSFNTTELYKIDQSLNGEHPIYGNELTYISKSFSLYNEYFKLLGVIQKNAKKLKTKRLQHLVELSVSLTKIEMVIRNYFPIIENKTMRLAINEDDLTYNIKVNDFKKILREVLRRRLYRKIQKLTDKLPSNLSVIPTTSVEVKNIIQHISSSAVHKNIMQKKYKKSELKAYKKKVNKLFRQDHFFKFKRFLLHHLSGAFGNLVGSIRWRYGRLLHNEKIIQEILMQLKPLDIITEKTWFAATDTFIPGHFGHNAIWLGTKEQLLANGMWIHPSIVRVHSQIEEGKSIIESDRTGTHLKDLRTFMNVDEFAILKLKNLDTKPREYVEKLYTVALGQLGKAYDFNFDVETTDKIVCSELLYQSFGEITWPTEVYLNRFTISPDNVTSLALYKNSPIELTYYVAQVKKDISDLRYKTMDDLALDIGFKNIDGRYYRTHRVCTVKNKRKNCVDEYIELIY